MREYALECLDHLVALGVKALVIACNSASAAMLRDARERYDVPVVEVIFPATRRAVAATRTGRIGVICTRGHGRVDGLRRRVRRRPARDAGRPSPARASSTSSRPASPAARSSSASPTTTSTRWSTAGVDTLILGCTHYPLLTGVISYVMGDEVTLVSSAEECAKDVYKMLVATDLMRQSGEPTYRFLTTGSPEEFETIGRRFLGPELAARHPVRRGPRRWAASEADRRRLLRLLPRSRLARQLLPRRGRRRRRPRTWRILLDLGNGALGALHRYVDPLDVDAVFLSHLHADHCLDLCGYYVLRKYHPTGPQPRIPVWGPAGTAERMARGLRPAGRARDDRGVRLPRPRRAGRGRAVHGRGRAGGAPRRRRTGCG